MRNVEELINIGPKLTKQLHEIGVFTEDDLRQLGIPETFRRLFFRYRDEMYFTSVYLYAMEGALNDMHWNAISQKRKDELKSIFKEIYVK